MPSPRLKINRPLKKGKLVLSAKDQADIKALYEYHKDGDIMSLTIQKYKKKRSEGQRGYYFGVIVKMLCEELWGETHAKAMEDMNDHLKKSFNPEYYTTPEGNEEVRGKSIEKEKTDRVEEIYSQIRMYAT
jgi:hypothetical protein